MACELFSQIVADTAGHRGVQSTQHMQVVVLAVLCQSEHHQNRLTCEMQWCDTRRDDRDLLIPLEQLRYENQRPTMLALLVCTPHRVQGCARRHAGLHGASGLQWWCTAVTSRQTARDDGINLQKSFHLLL